MLSIDWKGLALPLAYLFVLGGALMTFSSIYRRRKANESANLAPWFGPNLQRDIYYSLLQMDPGTGANGSGGAAAEKAGPRVPDSVLRAALLRRAVQDIDRLIHIKTAKQACGSLLQRGSVGDDLWQRFLRAEKEMEEELRDVVTEANALAPHWGASIFQSAHEIAANAKLRQRLEEIQSQTEAEKAWWEKKRGQIRSEFMKELEESEKGSTKGDDDAVVVVQSPKKNKN